MSAPRAVTEWRKAYGELLLIVVLAVCSVALLILAAGAVSS